MSFLNKQLVTILVFLTAMGTVVGCSESDPTEVSVDLLIKEGALDRDNKIIKVKHNDIVTFKIAAEEYGSVHLHGYDFKVNVGPDTPGILNFTADATGKYPFTFHTLTIHRENAEGKENSHEEEGHGVLFESHTLETGQSFSFTIPTDQMESTILFHNHMNHEMQGAIKVAESAPKTDSIQLEIKEDGSFEPHNILVRHGTKIVWVNRGSKRARPTSGEPPMAKGNGHGHNEEDEPEAEIVLGSFEVHPR